MRGVVGASRLGRLGVRALSLPLKQVTSHTQVSEENVAPVMGQGRAVFGRMNWQRVLVCGLITGGVWTVLSVILLAAVGQEFMSALRQIAPERPGGVPFTLIANLVAGVWAMWLYTALRSCYGPGLKTAAVAGFAWWFIQSRQSAKWVTLVGALSNVNLYPLAAATLAAMVVAVMAGAWAYRE
jgi:hypothetical protein